MAFSWFYVCDISYFMRFSLVIDLVLGFCPNLQILVPPLSVISIWLANGVVHLIWFYDILKLGRGPFAGLISAAKALAGPKYDGKYLNNLVKGILGDTKLNQTLTNVVIPTFDIKLLQPTIFSTYEVPNNPNLDALVSDICISTSAAPTYFPAYYFKTTDSQGNEREYNLIDGGVSSNNPVWIFSITLHNKFC